MGVKRELALRFSLLTSRLLSRRFLIEKVLGSLRHTLL